MLVSKTNVKLLHEQFPFVNIDLFFYEFMDDEADDVRTLFQNQIFVVFLGLFGIENRSRQCSVS